MLYSYLTFPFLLQSQILPENAPWWIAGIFGLLAAIGTFWGKISGFFELKLKGQQAIAQKKLELAAAENDKNEKEAEGLKAAELEVIKLSYKISGLEERIEKSERDLRESKNKQKELEIENKAQRDQVLALRELTSSLSTGLVMALGVFQKNPDNKVAVDHILELINQATEKDATR